jgi:hypothetical protein
VISSCNSWLVTGDHIFCARGSGLLLREALSSMLYLLDANVLITAHNEEEIMRREAAA